MGDDPRPVGTFAALKVRDFSLLWTGQSVSSLGDGVFTIALALVALHIGHSAVDLSYVLAARAVPSVIFALLGGVVVDRVSRRLAMLVGDEQSSTVGIDTHVRDFWNRGCILWSCIHGHNS